jgi:hypothetical protein
VRPYLTGGCSQTQTEVLLSGGFGKGQVCYVSLDEVNPLERVLLHNLEIYYLHVTPRVAFVKMNSEETNRKLSEADLWDMNWRDEPLGL